MIQPWQTVSSTPVGDYRIFTIRSDKKISPRTGQERDFYVIDSVNWVNIVAITPDQQLVVVEQYRMGSNTVELEIPGGMMDKADASPVMTAIRELREETGYEGGNARILGQTFANPAIMSNVCYTVIIENCRCTHPLEWDHDEDLETRLIPLAELPQLVAQGKINHPLVIVGLYFFDLYQRGLKKA
jgi:ADP-ribose pyrophosphatase